MSLSLDSLYSHAGRFTHAELEYLQTQSRSLSTKTEQSLDISLSALKKICQNWGTPFGKPLPDALMGYSEAEVQKLYNQHLQAFCDEIWSEVLSSLLHLSPEERLQLKQSLQQAQSSSQMVMMDLPCGRTAKHTRLIRALEALEQAHTLQSALLSDVKTSFDHHLRQFVWAMLQPREKNVILDITDVYGEEANVPNAWNDATQIRAFEHWREVKARYGVDVDVYNQGTSINAPEQCGFYALVALNQARRAHMRAYGDGRIVPRCLMLNNSARVATADGITDGAEASKSTALLYFRCDLGDGVEHYGVTYGHATLTYLKPYITELWELPDTDAGTQFRSLEFEKHIGLLVAMSGGALPLCYRVTPLYVRGWGTKDIIPSFLDVVEYAQFLGVDKYGNAITATSAELIFQKFLSHDAAHGEVSVTILDRTLKTVLVEKSTYTLARSLGSIRHGGHALWESSTPCTEEPLRGFLSLGIFKKETNDVNPHVLEHTIPAGSMIRIESI